MHAYSSNLTSRMHPRNALSPSDLDRQTPAPRLRYLQKARYHHRTPVPLRAITPEPWLSYTRSDLTLAPANWATHVQTSRPSHHPR
jgi:hypothetical protein